MTIFFGAKFHFHLKQYNVTVQLDSEIKKIRAAVEEVQVPSGVTLKVKRSRTVEHTVSVEWRNSGTTKIDVGLHPIITASIKGEIGRIQGQAYQKSETVEYEVELNGSHSNRYKLIWTDVWRKGVAEFRQNDQTQILPFQFREKTELKIEESV